MGDVRVRHPLGVVLAARSGHDAPDRQPELARELEVALVVRGHGHDGAGPVGGQHVVRDPDGDPLAVDRVDRLRADRHPGLLALGRQALDLGLPPRPLDIGPHRLAVLGSGHLVHERVLRRQDHEGHAKQGVRARGVDAHRLGLAFDREVDLHAVAAPDPVRLHGPDLLRPGLQHRQVVQQPVGVLPDLEEPLLQVALLDRHVGMSPAGAVDDLLVRQHGLVHRAPVDRRQCTIRQPHLVEEQEQPLRPAVVVGVAGRDLPPPVVEDADHGQLLFGPGDVLQRPLARVRARLHGGVLRGQAEGVPAERVEHLVTAHPLEPAEQVTDHVVPHVPHVQIAAGVGIHDEVVVGRPVRDVGCLHHPALAPDLLPLGLDRLGHVAAALAGCSHGHSPPMLASG